MTTIEPSQKSSASSALGESGKLRAQQPGDETERSEGQKSRDIQVKGPSEDDAAIVDISATDSRAVTKN